MRNSVGAVLRLERGGGFRRVAGIGGGEIDDVDVLRDLFLGSAGEWINVSVVGAKSTAGGGGGEAGMEGRDSDWGEGAEVGVDRAVFSA